MEAVKATQKKFIDIEEVIGTKNPQLLRMIPRFVLNYMKRIIHQDAINTFIIEHGHNQDIEFAKAIVTNFGVKLEFKGQENIPLNEGCIFASNHPLGGLDAMALISATSTVRTDIKFLVNDILMNLKNLEGLFIPVNKHGKNSANSLQRIEDAYASSQIVMVFPAGLVSRRQKGVVKDLQWKKSFVTKAKKHNKLIVPIHIEGQNSGFFYGLANWRKRLGVKANIEMFYLVDEMYKQKNQKIKITFGKPINPVLLNNKHSNHDWAELIKKHVYHLGQTSNPNLTFNV